MEEHRSLGFWAAIGGTLVAISGIVAGVGLWEESNITHGDVWSNAWFLLGGAIFLIGCVVLVIVLVVAGRRWVGDTNSRDDAPTMATFSLVDPSPSEPRVPRRVYVLLRLRIATFAV